MANYEREVRMGGDIWRKGKVEKTTEFVERMKKVQKEAGAVLKKYTDRNRKETKKWKKGDRIMLSTKDLVFKERPIRKLVKRYVGPYKIEEIISTNVVKLQLPSSMRIHLVVNVSQIVQYREQVRDKIRKRGNQ